MSARIESAGGLKSSRERKMADGTRVDIGGLVDRAKLRGIHILVVALAFLAVVIDGYDIFVAGFIAPNIGREWHVPPQQMGMMFSIGLLGVVIGAPLLGALGDRIGRRRAIVIGSIFYGVMSLACLYTTEIVSFTVLRFLIGLGVGGVIPSAIALVAEFLPGRSRTVAMLLLMAGAPVGQLLPAIVAATLVPSFGWHMLLWVGGLAPIVIGLICWVALPESLKFLALHPQRRDELVGLINRIQPEPMPPANAVYYTSEPALRATLNPGPLFAAGRVATTLLLWLCLSMAILAVYFISNWLPSVLASTGLSNQEAAQRMAMLSIGGTAGAVASAWLVLKFGPLAILLTGLVGGAVICALGTQGLSTGQLVGLMFASGFCVIASINAVECVMGLVYPTPIRALATGWGLGVARLISMAGPVIGGFLIGAHLPNLVLFAVPGVALAICGVASIALRGAVGADAMRWTESTATH